MTWGEGVELALVVLFMFLGGVVGYHVEAIRLRLLQAELEVAMSKPSDADISRPGTGGAMR